MILRDDEFINESFDKIFGYLPNESPVVLFFFFSFFPPSFSFFTSLSFPLPPFSNQILSSFFPFFSALFTFSSSLHNNYFELKPKLGPALHQANKHHKTKSIFFYFWLFLFAFFSPFFFLFFSFFFFLFLLCRHSLTVFETFFLPLFETKVSNTWKYISKENIIVQELSIRI